MASWKQSLLVVVFASATLSACSSTKAPPENPPQYTGQAPELSGKGYASHVATRVFNAPIEPLREYIQEEHRIVAAMEETDDIKKPVDLVYLHGDWPEEGAVRRLEFSDGHYALERVLKNDYPTYFQYQVWSFTNAAGSNLKYATGIQEWRDLGDERTEMTWTYKAKPNAGYKHFFVQRFVSNSLKPLMENALDVVQVQVEEHFHPSPSE